MSGISDANFEKYISKMLPHTIELIQSLFIHNFSGREDIITEIQEKVLRRGRTHPEELQTRLAGYPRKDDNIIKTDKV